MNAKHERLMECQKELNRWRAEHAAWLADIKKWKRQEQRVLVLLFELERAMPNQRIILNEHADTIRKHEKTLNGYKKYLVEYHKMDIDDKRYAEMMDMHRKSKEQHVKVARKHAEMRLKHLAAISEISNLAKVLLPDGEQ